MASATWNAIDEYPRLQTIPNLLLVLSLWFVLPGINLIVAFCTRMPVVREIIFILAIIYAVVFGFYALNGSTVGGPEGAQQMHLLMLPLLLFMFAPLFSIALLLLHGLHSLRRKSSARPTHTNT
jgi:hypothetical protein